MCFEPRAETDYLIKQSTSVTAEGFMRDDTFRRAFVRRLEIIGEAAKKVPDDFRARYPAVEWRAMAGIARRIIHAYFGVDYQLVWDVVQNRVPCLREQVASILDASHAE